MDKPAKATLRSAAEVLHEHATLNEWQIEEIRRAIEEAGRGEFAPETEVKATFDRFRGL